MLPIQKLSYTKKNAKWRENCIDALEQLCYSNNSKYRADMYKKKINYDLFNGKFHRQDLLYVASPLGLNEGADSYPANLQHFDIISPDLLLLMGEETKRPFNYRVVSKGDHDVNQALVTKRKMLEQYAESVLFDQETKEIMDPEQIEKYIKYTYRDIKEVNAQYMLDLLIQYNDLEAKCNIGWKDVLVAGEEIYYVGEAHNEPFVEVCNPLDIHYIIDDNSMDISESSAIVYRKNMSLSQIIDLWYDELTDDQIRDLESRMSNYTMSGSTGSSVNYIPTYVNFGVDGQGNISSAANASNRSNTGGALLPVLRCEWKSIKKIGFLTYTDEQGMSQMTIVDEAFKKGPQDKIEWYWVSEWWEGVKIAEDIYIGIQPKKNQRRNLDNPSDCKPGFIGRIYNARNSQSISLIDRMKPYQYLYNITYYRLEMGMAKSKGKLLLMDITQIPSQNGWNLQKWLYYLEALGIAFIDPLQKPAAGGNPSSFNQFTSIDMELGSFIDRHIMLLDKIEERMSQLSGVSRQRRGQITSEDGLGTSERSVTQSSHITEYWFKNHSDVKKQVLEALLDVAKNIAPDSKKIQYVTNDLGKIFHAIDKDDFANAEYGIFVSNSSKDEKLLEALRGLSQAALQYDKASLSDIVSMMESNSITEIKRKLIDAEDKSNQMKQQAGQQQAQAQQQQIQQDSELKQKEFELKKYEIDTNNETKIQVEEIRSFMFQKDQDVNDNGAPDQIEIAKLALQERKLKADEMSTHLGLVDADRERQHDSTENEKDRKVKLADIEAKKVIARSRPKPSSKK